MTHWPSGHYFSIGSSFWGGDGDVGAEGRLLWPATQVGPVPIYVSLLIGCLYKECNAERSTDIPFFDGSCGGLAVLSTCSFPLLLVEGVIEFPTSGQPSLSSTDGTGLGGCRLRGLTTKGSSFSGPRVKAPFVGRVGRKDTALSRNPELVLGSRSCDATDGGGSFAGGMTDDLCVA